MPEMNYRIYRGEILMHDTAVDGPIPPQLQWILPSGWRGVQIGVADTDPWYKRLWARLLRRPIWHDNR
jgi:hypothetical protein